MAHFNRIPLQFELVTIHVGIQVEILVLIAFTVN